MTRLTTLLLVVIFAMAGCTPKTGISTNPSPIPLPDAYSTGEDGTTGAATADGPHRDRWWLEFDDPQLHSYIDRALNSNFSLRATRERLIQARAVARKAGADLVPSVDGRLNVSEKQRRENSSTTSESDLLIGIAADYELDLWNRLQSTEEAALLDANARNEDLQAAALTIAAQVANVWYQLIESNRQLQLLKQQQEVNELGLELIRVRFTAGQIGIADLLQQQQLIESKNGEQALQKVTSETLFNQLAILTGSSPGELLLPEMPEITEFPPLPSTGIPADLLTNRPDIKSDYLELKAADKRVAAAIADRYPKISITADLNSSGSSTGDLFDNWLASLAANLLTPIIDGGKRKAEVDRTSAVAREKLNTYSQTVITAVGEVEDALSREREQRAYLDSLEIQLSLATRTIANVRDRYKQGAEDYQRVLTALLSQQGLERNLLSGKRQLITYRVDLYRALGGTAIAPGQSDNIRQEQESGQ